MSREFEVACQVYYDRVCRFLLALTGDMHQAEDLTQEVFYRALLHIGRYKEQGQMFTWLWRHREKPVAQPVPPGGAHGAAGTRCVPARP